jgi:hypothetical protein
VVVGLAEYTTSTSGVPAEHELGCTESQTVANSATSSVLKSTDYCECPGWEPPGRPQRELMRMAHELWSRPQFLLRQRTRCLGRIALVGCTTSLSCRALETLAVLVASVAKRSCCGKASSLFVAWHRSSSPPMFWIEKSCPHWHRHRRSRTGGYAIISNWRHMG